MLFVKIKTDWKKTWKATSIRYVTPLGFFNISSINFVMTHLAMFTDRQTQRVCALGKSTIDV